MARRIALAADHGGYQLKEHILAYLAGQGYDCVDFGTSSEASCDYPDYARPACEAVVRGDCECALLFCGTGVGISMAANKIKGMRACCCSDAYSAEMTRSHNDANALCLGGRVVGFGLGEKLVDTFLATGFSGGANHARRIEKITLLEKENA